MHLWCLSTHLVKEKTLNPASTLSTHTLSASHQKHQEAEQHPIRRHGCYRWFFSIFIVIPIVAPSATPLTPNADDNLLKAILVPCDKNPRQRRIPDCARACRELKICQLISWLKSSHRLWIPRLRVKQWHFRPWAPQTRQLKNTMQNNHFSRGRAQTLIFLMFAYSPQSWHTLEWALNISVMKWLMSPWTDHFNFRILMYFRVKLIF